MLDEESLGVVRLLHYGVQFERDPAADASIAWAIESVVERDERLSRAGFLEHIRRALAADDDLAERLEVDDHSNAQIRAFLRGVAARLEPAPSRGP